MYLPQNHDGHLTQPFRRSPASPLAVQIPSRPRRTQAQLPRLFPLPLLNQSYPFFIQKIDPHLEMECSRPQCMTIPKAASLEHPYLDFPSRTMQGASKHPQRACIGPILSQRLFVVFAVKVFRRIIGWMMKNARNVMTARVYLRLGDVSIIAGYVVKYSVLDVLQI